MSNSLRNRLLENVRFDTCIEEAQKAVADVLSGAVVTVQDKLLHVTAYAIEAKRQIHSATAVAAVDNELRQERGVTLEEKIINRILKHLPREQLLTISNHKPQMVAAMCLFPYMVSIGEWKMPWDAGHETIEELLRGVGDLAALRARWRKVEEDRKATVEAAAMEEQQIAEEVAKEVRARRRKISVDQLEKEEAEKAAREQRDFFERTVDVALNAIGADSMKVKLGTPLPKGTILIVDANGDGRPLPEKMTMAVSDFLAHQL